MMKIFATPSVLITPADQSSDRRLWSSAFTLYSKEIHDTRGIKSAYLFFSEGDGWCISDQTRRSLVNIKSVVGRTSCDYEKKVNCAES